MAGGRSDNQRTAPLAATAALVVSRPWHVAVAAFAIGVALAEAADGAAGVPFLALVAGAFAAVLAVCRAPAVGALAGALVLAGGAVGEARLAAIDGPADRLGAGGAAELRAHLLTRPRPSAFGSSAEVRVASGRLAGARLLARIARWTRFPDRVAVGSELVLEGRLRPVEPSGVDRDGIDFGAYLRRRGIAGELLVDWARPTGGRRTGVAGLLDRLQVRAEEAVAAGLPGPEAALARGMVLGQDEAIAEAVRKDFRESGLAHLLAVSGQNVMLLVALALPFLAAGGVGPRARGVALLLLVALYVPLAGAGPSLQRAGVMGVAGIAAMTLSRPSSRWYALLLAAAVTLTLNPRSLLDPGWQLSFAAVVGILVLGVPLGGALSRAADLLFAPTVEAATVGARAVRILSRGFAEGTAITLAATLATAPLLAHHFEAVSLAALPANLLALPAVAPAMWLGMVKAALGLLAPALPGADWLAAAIGPVTRVPVAYLGGLAERFAGVPGSSIGLSPFSARGVALAYALIAAAGVAVRYMTRRHAARGEELAGRWRRLPARRRAAACALVLAAVLFLAVRTLAAPAPPDHLTVSFLDVGQGDATLIQHPDGTAILFDGGPPEAGVERLLRRAGVRRLALVVATHASRDHEGGLPAVLARYPVDLLLDGGDGTAEPGFRAVLAAARRSDVRTLPALAPMDAERRGRDGQAAVPGSPSARPCTGRPQPPSRGGDGQLWRVRPAPVGRCRERVAPPARPAGRRRHEGAASRQL